MEENQNPTPDQETTTLTQEQPDTSAQSETPAVTSESTETVENSEAPAAPSVTNPAQIPAHASGGNKHLVAIVVAVVVMLGLLGAVAYLYMQQNSSSIKPADNKAAQTNKTEPVSAADVDSASKEVDASLDTIDADKDFSSADLSDATLGL